MKQDEVRLRLIDGTIHVIAEDGMDKASTKQIGKATDTNEVYIYRCFRDKEDLFAKTFDALDEELFKKTMQGIDVLYMTEMEFELRCRLYFSAIWGFLIGNHDKCLTYRQYMYSPYFVKYSIASHKKRFMPLVEKFKEAFIDEADVWMILSHILNIILDFAVKVHNNEMSKEDNYTEHVFRVIYRSIEQYFKR